jgi:hypothetical protein
LAIFDITGKKIITLFYGYLTAGFYELKWHGTNQFGDQVAPGVYFYNFNSKNHYDVKRMVLVK